MNSNAWIIARNLWYTGNYWARWAILIIALWPIVITIAALIGWPALTAIVALIPFLAIAFGFIAAFDPLVIAIIATAAIGRKFLMAIAGIIATELAIGVFMSAVPVANDRGLIPVALVAMLAIAFFALSGIKGKVIAALSAVLVGVAAVMFLGGRDEAAVKVTSFVAPSPAAPAAAGGKVYIVTAQAETLVSVGDGKGYLSPDVPVFVRTPGGTKFLLLPDMSLCKFEGDKCEKTDVIAEVNGFTPAVLFVRAKEGKGRVYRTPA